MLGILVTVVILVVVVENGDTDENEVGLEVMKVKKRGCWRRLRICLVDTRRKDINGLMSVFGLTEAKSMNGERFVVGVKFVECGI